MRIARFVLPAAAIAAAGAAAYAGRPAVHVAEYRLPGGGIARVRYTGDVPPRLLPVRAADASPFAALDRIAAIMDARADAILAAAPAGGPAIATAPAGARTTSISTTTSGGRVCTTQVSIVSRGDGKAPETIRKVSGDCAAAPVAPAKPAAPARPAAVPRDSI